jgi:hypothetical protein
VSAFPIHWVPATFFTMGHPAPLIAIVHHRMVGTLAGTDRTFTTGPREASTHFGVGLCSKHGGQGSVCIHQYVLLGDQAWGNGNNRTADGRLVKSEWNDRYPQRLVNSRTISIEHHDNGGRGSSKRGIVPDEVIEASIWLDARLLAGDGKRLEAAGVRFRQGLRSTICRELRAINPGRHSIVDHHYIAGRLKPFCWQPWQQDAVGFPQARYLDALRLGHAGQPVEGGHPGHGGAGGDPDPADGSHGSRPTSEGSEEEVMRSFQLPPVPTLATIRRHAWLYDNSAREPSRRNINIDPGREMPLVGIVGNDARIVSYVDASGTAVGKAYWVEAADVESTRPAP